MRKFKIGDIVKVTKLLSQDKEWGITIDEIGEIVEEDLKDYRRYFVRFTGKKELVPMCDYQMELIVKEKNISISFAPQPMSLIQNLEDIIKGPILQYSTTFDELATTENNKKEENNMEILELYKERKTHKIEQEKMKKINELKEEDNVQKILRDAENQINVLLDNDEDNAFKLGYVEIVTQETHEKISEVKEKFQEQKIKLIDDYQEIKAMLSMTNNYEEQIKILKNYGIIDKKTNKLNV